MLHLPSTSSGEWSADLTVLPKIDEGTITEFCARKDPSGRQLQKAYCFATETYAEPSSVATCTSDLSSALVHVRGHCYKSQKKSSQPYPVKLSFSTENGSIVASSCTCPAGSSGACSHVLAFVRLLVILHKEGYKEPPPALSCTELPQQWRRPRQPGVAPASVKDVDWRRVCEGGREMPRYAKSHTASPHEDEERQVHASIRKLGSKLGSLGKSLFSSVLLNTSEQLVTSKLGLAPRDSPASYHQAQQPSGFTTWLGNLHPGTSSFHPVPRLQPFMTSTEYVPEGKYSEREKTILDELSLSPEQARNLEKNTRQQGQSQTWMQARQHRLTASAFGKVIQRREWTHKGLRNLLDPKDLSRVRAIQYGRRKEADAVSRYIAVLQKLGHDVSVRHCGIFVDPSCPWLGATPDRLVFDPEEGTYGVLEVKCPYSMKDLDSSDVPSFDFYINFLGNGEPQLLRDHEYYHQILGQMALTSCQWADFVVYSEKWAIIERVRFQPLEWQEMKAHLDYFFFNNALKFFCSTE